MAPCYHLGAVFMHLSWAYGAGLCVFVVGGVGVGGGRRANLLFCRKADSFLS